VVTAEPGKVDHPTIKGNVKNPEENIHILVAILELDLVPIIKKNWRNNVFGKLVG
jgi:hypothetical protein